MFIELTQVYRDTAKKTGGQLFVNPNSLLHMQTGLLVNGVKVTALAVAPSGTLYVTETPEQIMALIGGDDAPASIKFKVQVRSVNGWADLKASVDGGSYEVELYDSESAAHDDVSDEVDADGYRVVFSHTPADDDLY